MNNPGTKTIATTISVYWSNKHLLPIFLSKKSLKSNQRVAQFKVKKRVLLLTPFFVRKRAFSDLDTLFYICE